MDLYEVTRTGTVNGEARTFTDYVVASSLANAASIHQQTAPEGLVLNIRGLGGVLAIEAEGDEYTDAVSQMGFRLQEDEYGDEAEEESESLRRRQGKVRRVVRALPKR